MDYGGGQYRQRNPDWHAADSPWKAQRIEEMIERNNIWPRRIFEVGCGAGSVLAALASARLTADTEYFGLDISRDAIDQATISHGEIPSLRFEVGGVEDVEGVFDLILLIDVIEHVEDYFALLRAAGRVGRNLIIHIPIDMTVSSAFRRHLITDSRAAVGHIHVFNRDTAIATLRETGFQIVDETFTAGSLAPTTRGFKSSVASVPRRILRSVSPDLAAHLLGGFSLLVLARPQTGPNSN